MICFYSASSRQLCRTEHVSEFSPSASASVLCPVRSPSLQEWREQSLQFLAVFCGSDEEPVESDHVVPPPTGHGGQVLWRRGVLARASRWSWGERARGPSWVCAAGLTWSRWALGGQLGGSRSSRMGQGSGVQCGVRLTLPFEAQRGWSFEVCLVEAYLLDGFTLLSLP